MREFLVPILTLTGLGLLFGLVLSWAAKKFAVAQDPRIKEVMDRLPGANCGACGLPGCARFAEALSKAEVCLDNCKACSMEAAAEIAKILGTEFSVAKKKVAVLRCYGGKQAKDKFVYQGIEDCQAATQLLGGQKLCSYACLGFGNCQKACPFGAIRMSLSNREEGLPIIDSALCTGCGKCIQACPRDLLVLVPPKAKVFVGCNSHNSPKLTAAACSVGCIACKKCIQVCPENAIKMVENLVVIDYDKCTSCGRCIEVCPRNIMVAKAMPYRTSFQPNI